MTFFVISGLFIFLLVNFFLEYFILFIGKDFREGVGIVPVVLMANLIMGIFFNLSIWYKLTNKTHFGAILVILGAAITVVINVLFIPRYGYVASAWGHLICYSVMVVVSYAWSRKHYAVPYKTLRIAGYISVAMVFFFLNELFLQNMERMKEVFGLLLLGVFISWAIYRERSVFNAYKGG
jgi:O-antigen/teichoic acid export membrane protein